MTRTFKIWFTTRRLAKAESTYARLRGDLPYTRETWQQAEDRLEDARRRVAALRSQLTDLTAADPDAYPIAASGR